MAKPPNYTVVACRSSRMSYICAILSNSCALVRSATMALLTERVNTIMECLASDFRVPLNFTCFFSQSFLPVLAWKTTEKTWKISPDLQDLTLNIWHWIHFFSTVQPNKQCVYVANPLWTSKCCCCCGTRTIMAPFIILASTLGQALLVLNSCCKMEPCVNFRYPFNFFI